MPGAEPEVLARTRTEKSSPGPEPEVLARTRTRSPRQDQNQKSSPGLEPEVLARTRTERAEAIARLLEVNKDRVQNIQQSAEKAKGRRTLNLPQDAPTGVLDIIEVDNINSVE